MLMHPYDVANPPTGAGWMIQIVCHHYNPYPSSQADCTSIPTAMSELNSARTSSSPSKCLSKLNDPTLRLFGVHHVALAWMSHDKEWTTEKGATTTTLPATPSRCLSELVHRKTPRGRLAALAWAARRARWPRG